MNIQAERGRASSQRKTSLFLASFVTTVAAINSVLVCLGERTSTTSILGVIVAWFAASFSWSTYFGYRSTERSLTAFGDALGDDE